MIFTESDHSRIDISSLLERLSASLANKNIQTVIKTVAEKLLAKVEASTNVCENADSDAIFDSDDDEEMESECEDYLDDFSFLQGSSKPRAGQLGGTSLPSNRLKKDLQTVQSAGISVGIFPRRPLREAEFFSMSLRVAKLGIPEHALEAWGLKSHEYLVLLCRFPSHYPMISELLEKYIDEWTPKFRFGKCSKPKPSIETARLAFMTSSDGNSDDQNAPSDKAKDVSGSFIPLYMSNSINMLMNHEFLALLKIRRIDGSSWDGALSRLKLYANRCNEVADLSGDDTPDTPVSENAIPSLSHDYALDGEEKFSLPMTAMQFALRHLARCTKYCMVCHQRLEDEFEALKPYVCSSPLCTYQFMTLGLGASIEHEIVSNPYVVDILISFFATALSNAKCLRKYPAGLNLKSVFTGSKGKPAVHIFAKACFYDRSIRFGTDGYEKMNPKIKVGDSLMVVIEGAVDVPVASILSGSK